MGICEILDTKTWRWHVCGEASGENALQLDDGRIFLQIKGEAPSVNTPMTFDPLSEKVVAASKRSDKLKHWYLLTVHPSIYSIKAADLWVDTWTSAREFLATQWDSRTVLNQRAEQDCEKCDLLTDQTTPTNSLLCSAMGSAVAVLHDGRVLVLGGDNFDASQLCQLYDPKSGVWRSAMKVPRFEHTVTVLSDGRVLAVGGALNQNALTSCELYAPPEPGPYCETHRPTSQKSPGRAGRVAGTEYLSAEAQLPS